MKKTIFLGLAALLALAVFSCDGNFTKPDVDDGPRVMQTEDGQTMVRLDIGFKDNARALTVNTSIVATERYEVAFEWTDGTDTEVYRTSWADGERGRLWVKTDPTGIDYAGKAIIFVGYSNGTILAVGNLTHVDGVPSTTISDASRQVTFAVTPLTNDIYGTPDFTKSTFQILTPTASATADLTAPFPQVKINGSDYPVYELPKGLNGASAATASYTINGLPSTGIVIAAIPRVIPRLVTASRYFSAMDVTGNFAAAMNPGATTDTPLPAPPWSLTLNTKTNDGLIKISFEIPVFAISSDDGYEKDLNTQTITQTVKPGMWYIRGGISNTVLDMGVGQDSDGGAVLVGVGNYPRPSEDGFIYIDTP